MTCRVSTFSKSGIQIEFDTGAAPVARALNKKNTKIWLFQNEKNCRSNTVVAVENVVVEVKTFAEIVAHFADYFVAEEFVVEGVAVAVAVAEVVVVEAVAAEIVAEVIFASVEVEAGMVLMS
ncbi:hypothetical protein Tco_0928994 [Tanacetum coccineum]